MKKVAILIPVFNNLDFTKKCIKTLDKLISDTSFNNCDFLIVVVDDGSTDGTEEWLTDHHPEVTVLKGDGNLWWSGGVNLGASYAVSETDADFLLLWNNDIIPASNYFIELDQLVDNLTDNIIAGSIIFYFGTDIIWSFGGIFNPKSGMKYLLGSNLPDSDEFKKPRKVDWLPGMGTLVPVDVIRKIGYWDEKVFPQYHGDSDFTFRARTAGYDIIVYPELKLWNDKTNSGINHEGTFKGLYLTMTDIRSKSQLRKNFHFYKRHSTSILAYRVLVVDYFRLFGGFFKWKLLTLFGISKRV